MNFYFDQFLEGMIDAIKLSKLGSDGIFDKAEGSSILPNIDSQSKWQFARTPGHIHLTDGMTVHVFYLPEGEKTEDFPAHKVQDVPIIDFGKDHTSKGTAQVHRANPGLIYFTMQDGHANPTYTFKHTNSHEWHAIPKKRKVQQFTNAPTTSTPPIQETTNTIQVDSKAFENGVKDKLASFDGILDASLKGIHSLSRGAVRGLDTMGRHPLASAGIGLGLGAAYDQGKRHLYNTPEENEEETGGERALRYLAPSLGAGALGAGFGASFGNMQQMPSLFRP